MLTSMFMLRLLGGFVVLLSLGWLGVMKRGHVSLSRGLGTIGLLLLLGLPFFWFYNRQIRAEEIANWNRAHPQSSYKRTFID